MIHPNELRVGNKVLHNGSIDEVYAIHYRDSQMQAYHVLLQDGRSKSGYSLLDIEPIPLTHQILDSFGFAKQNTKSTTGFTIYCISNMQLFVDHSETPFSNIQVYHERMNGMATAYLGHRPDLKVHELQNLYFALNSKELIYTP